MNLHSILTSRIRFAWIATLTTFVLSSATSFAQRNVPVIDFGDDLCWHGGTWGLPHYRNDYVKQLYKGSKDGDCTTDVSGNGSTEKDSIAYYEFSMDVPYNPIGSFYNIHGNNTRFYGGAVTYWANRKPNWQEGGINIDHELRDDFNLHSYATEGGDIALRTFGVWLWKKEDFMNEGNQFKVSSDRNSRIALYVSRYFQDYEEMRFIVQDGNEFFISEKHPDSGKAHHLYEMTLSETKWAPYNPQAPYDIEFDPSTANFSSHQFKDIQSAGWYVAKPTLGKAALWVKWYAFGLDAVVNRPESPSYLVPMKSLSGGSFISKEPVSYGQWRTIYQWTNRNQYDMHEGHVYDRDGDMGMMSLDNATHSSADPVTDITALDALSWANALSAYEGLEPLFYTDEGFQNVLRKVMDRQQPGKENWRPEVFVKWSANGFRPATEQERPGSADGFYLVRSNSVPPSDASSAFADWAKRYQALDVKAVASNPNLKLIPVQGGSYIRKDGAETQIKSFYLAETETTFEQWKKVYAWAVNNGYTFDRDGDLGSMDWSERGTVFTQDEPVTQISHLDVLLWCNALSEMEGKTPAYYTDKAMTDVIKSVRRFRTENTEKGPAYYRLPDQGQMTFYVRWDVDGYRIPSNWEWQYAYRSGNNAQNTYPWGSEPIGDYAWYGENSSDRTHPVKQKKPNPWGFYDMAGNVFEWTMGGGDSYYLVDNPRGKNMPVAMGGSFRTEGSREIARMMELGGKPSAAIKSPLAIAYPEIGFRVARYDADIHPREAPPYIPEKVLLFDPAQVPTNPTLQGEVWRGNIARTGEFNAKGPLREPRLKWKFDTGKSVKASPVIVNGIVYIGSDDGNFYAIDLASGEEKWRVSTGSKIRSSAAVYAGKVFFFNGKGAFALDANTGQEIWRKGRGLWDDSPLIVPGPIQYKNGETLDGIVFYSQPWKGLVGLNIADGTAVWHYRDQHGPGKDGCSALVHRGHIIHFRGSQATEVVNLLTERQAYAIDGAVDFGYFTPAARDGVAYSFIRGVAAFDIMANIPNGTKGSHMKNYDFKWRFYPGKEKGWSYQNHGISSISVDATTVYFGHSNTSVYALDRETGDIKWEIQTNGINRSSPALGTGNLLFIGSYDKHVYGISKSDGKIVWKFATKGAIHSSPAIEGSTLVIGSDDGSVYALE